MFDLSDKVAVVTGGARGIGRGICTCLAKQNADIAIVDILEAEAEETCEEVQKIGRKANRYKVDLTERMAVFDVFKDILNDFGKIDILVNNAGWDKIEVFVKNDPETWEKIVKLNYMGHIYCIRAVLDHMIARNSGRIISISSDAARVGSSMEAVYSGAKGAIISFSKTLARELARNRITVNVVCPGPTMTPGVQAVIKETESIRKLFDAMDRIIPLKHMGTPEDIGAAVAFLASDEANFITGQTLSVSGGLTMV